MRGGHITTKVVGLTGTSKTTCRIASSTHMATRTASLRGWHIIGKYCRSTVYNDLTQLKIGVVEALYPAVSIIKLMYRRVSRSYRSCFFRFFLAQSSRVPLT